MRTAGRATSAALVAAMVMSGWTATRPRTAAVSVSSSPIPNAAAAETTPASPIQPAPTTPSTSSTPTTTTTMPVGPTAPDGRAFGVDPTGQAFPAADPAIVRDGAVWRLFTTQDYLANVPSWESTDGETWFPTGDVLPELPGWAAWGQTWAPDIVEVDGGWVLFFSALVVGTDRHCIGHAVAGEAVGPFRASLEPLVCELDEGGSIDPSVFTGGDGRHHLLWKVDANALGDGQPSRLRSRPLNPSATRFVGESTDLLEYGAAGEWPLIEQPEMVEVDGTHHLFYASGWFNQPGYQVRQARCSSAAGPCERVGETGVVVTEPGVEGPGALSLVPVDDGWLGVHHAWRHGFGEGAFRSLVVTRFDPEGPSATG